MRTAIVLIVALLSVAGSCFAEERPTIRHIPPEDVVQASIQVLRYSLSSDPSFAVKWTYTEAGAKKAIAYWEAHPTRDSTNAAQWAHWKAGWISNRTDKCLFKTEAAARAFMAELRSE